MEVKIHVLPDGIATQGESTLVHKTDNGGGVMAALFDAEYKDGYTYTISLRQTGRAYIWRILRAGNGVAYTVARGSARTPIKAMDDAFAARRRLVQPATGTVPARPA